MFGEVVHDASGRSLLAEGGFFAAIGAGTRSHRPCGCLWDGKFLVKRIRARSRSDAEQNAQGQKINSLIDDRSPVNWRAS